MKKSRRKERKGKANKKLIGLILIVSLIIIVTVYYATLGTSSPKQKYTAEEYFEILDPFPSGDLSEDGSQMLLYYLLFRIRPFMGDAHEVFVNSGGVGMTEPTWVGTILEGEEETVFLSFERLPINLRLKDGEFAVSFQITSVEATGPVTIRFPPPTNST